MCFQLCINIKLRQKIILHQTQKVNFEVSLTSSTTPPSLLPLATTSVASWRHAASIQRSGCATYGYRGSWTLTIMYPVLRKMLYKGQVKLMHQVKSFMKNEAEDIHAIAESNRKSLYLKERFKHNVIRAGITSFNWKKDYKVIKYLTLRFIRLQPPSIQLNIALFNKRFSLQIKVIDTPGRVLRLLYTPLTAVPFMFFVVLMGCKATPILLTRK